MSVHNIYFVNSLEYFVQVYSMISIVQLLLLSFLWTGCRGERGLENFEVQPRQSYIPRTSFLTENELSVTQVYNSSKKFEPVGEHEHGCVFVVATICVFDSSLLKNFVQPTII